MKRVASKGGTTQAALDSLEGNDVGQLIHDAAYAAFHRAVEIGKEDDQQEETKTTEAPELVS